MTSGERLSAKLAARKATETAMLAAATQMLLESPSTDVLATLKPVEIARRTDPRRTTGAFYNIWPTQAEFRRALLDHVLNLERFTSDTATEDLIRDFLGRPELCMTEVIRVAATFNFEGMKGEPGVVLQHALWTRHEQDPEVRERLGRFYRSVTDSMSPLYTQLLARSGRRMRAPYELRTFAVTLTALVEGLHLRWAVDPESVPDDNPPPPGVEGDESWSLMASLTYLLFMVMTEPNPE